MEELCVFFLSFDLLFFLFVQVTASKHLTFGSFSHPEQGSSQHASAFRPSPAQHTLKTQLWKGETPTCWLRRPPTFQEACLEDTEGLKSKHLAGDQNLRQPYVGQALCFRELEEVSLRPPAYLSCPSTGRTGTGALVMCSVS